MKRLSIVVSSVIGLLLSGCGNSSSGTSSIGYLIDSPVAGVRYSCGNVSGITTASGAFSCRETPVIFTIGSYLLGSVNTLPSDGKVFPQDLVGVSRSDVTTQAVIDIARLLQSLDDDGNISSTITIPASVGTAFSSATGANDLNLTQLAALAGVILVDEASAIAHLETQIANATSGSGTLGNNESPAVIPTGVLGTHVLTFHAQSGSPITTDTNATFVVGSDNTLTIDGTRVLNIKPLIKQSNFYV